jgi:hypothetical protein
VGFFVLFCFFEIIFELGSYFMLEQAWTTSLFLPYYVAGDDRHVPPGLAIGWDGVLWTFLSRLASDQDPPVLWLLSSQDYRCEPSCWPLFIF